LQTIRTHSKYVQDVKFSSNGEYLASIGSDGKLFLYDGKEGSTIAEIAAHQGSIVRVTVEEPQ
jgi:WD40 repeat protein